MKAALRLHEQVQREVEWFESRFHRRGFYPQYGKCGLYVIVYTEHLPSGTIWERYVHDLDKYLAKNKANLSDFSMMSIVGQSKYVE